MQQGCRSEGKAVIDDGAHGRKRSSVEYALNLRENGEQFLVVRGKALRVVFHAGQDVAYRAYVSLTGPSLLADSGAIENPIHGVMP